MTHTTANEHPGIFRHRRVTICARIALAAFAVAVVTMATASSALAADPEASVDVTLLPLEGTSNASPDTSQTTSAASGEQHRTQSAEGAIARLAATGDGLPPLAAPLALAVIAGTTAVVLRARERRIARATRPRKRQRPIGLLLAAILAVGCLPAATPAHAATIDADARAAAVATTTAAARKADTWGDYSFDVVGTIAVGATVTVEGDPDPSYPSWVKPHFEWTSPDLDWAVLSTERTLIIPPIMRGLQLYLVITDDSGYVESTLVMTNGRVSMKLAGDPVITGDLSVGSTVTVEPNVNVGAIPTATWYSGPFKGWTTNLLGTGLSLELPASAEGLYITAVVTDAGNAFDGSVTAKTASVVEAPALTAPTLGSASIAANGNVTATCAVTPNGIMDSIALEVLGNDGSWIEVSRQNVSQDGSAEITGNLAAWLDDGSATVRAVAHGPYGSSPPSAAITVAAQIAVSVPLSMTCAVAGDGTVAPTEQRVQNTGELNIAVTRIDTSLGGTSGSAASWTCTMDGMTLFEGPFGSSSEPTGARTIAPGETAVLNWEARSIEFGGAALGATPMAYGTIAYAVSIAAG